MIGHAGGAEPDSAALILSTSVALGVLSLVLVASSVQDWTAYPRVYRKVSAALALTAAIAVAIGWLRPAPWLQMLALVLLLGLVWLYGILAWSATTSTPDGGP